MSNNFVIKRIPDATKQAFGSKITGVQEDALNRVSVLPEPFGLNKLYDPESPLNKELSRLLSSCVLDYVEKFFVNQSQPKSKGTEYWRRFLPPVPSLAEHPAIQLALSPKFFWADFILLPEVKHALAEDAAYELVDTLVSTVDFLDGEETLVSDWERKRPNYYDYANKNTLDYIGRLFSASDRNNKECSEGIRAVWLTRMAAFRLMDAHFTGRQTYKPDPKLGGVDCVYRKLTFDFATRLDRGMATDLEKRFGYVKVGQVGFAEYGLSQKNSDQTFLEMVYAETDPKKEGKFTFNHPVAQVASFISPIMSLVPERIRQRGLGSVGFLYSLYKKSKVLRDLSTASPLPELDMEDVNIDAASLGPNVTSRFSQDWCKEKFISPAWLSFAGFKPIVHKQTKELMAYILEGMPDFGEQLKSDEVVSALVAARTRKIVLEPILARGIQRECLALYKELSPSEYSITVQDAKDKHVEERLTNRISADIKSLNECFLQSVDFLVKNHEKTLAVIKRKAIKSEPDVPVYISVPESCNWVMPLSISP